jgi:hypothetical protein
LLPERLAICRLSPNDALPSWALNGVFWSILRSSTELSIVCPQEIIPQGIEYESGWRAFKVAGTIPFELTGILVSIASPIAEAGISIFAISSYNTDYVLVKEDNLVKAMNILTTAGHNFEKDNY